LRVHFPQPPPSLNEEDAADMFDLQESITRASTVRDEAARRIAAGSDDAPDPETATAIQRTFDPDNMLKRVLLPKCVEAGISDVHSRMNHAEMKLSVALEKLKPLKGKGSSLQHKRGRANLQLLRSLKMEVQARVSQPAKKKEGLSVRRRMDNFPKEGFCVVNCGVRCSCNHKLISGDNRDCNSTCWAYRQAFGMLGYFLIFSWRAKSLRGVLR
jgi:hypothetical protein